MLEDSIIGGRIELTKEEASNWVTRMYPWIRRTASSFCAVHRNDTDDFIQESIIFMLQVAEEAVSRDDIPPEKVVPFIKSAVLNNMRTIYRKTKTLTTREVVCAVEDECNEESPIPSLDPRTVYVDNRDEFQDVVTQFAFEHMMNMLTDLEKDILMALFYREDPGVENLLAQEQARREKDYREGRIKIVLPILNYGPPAWLLSERFNISKAKARQALENIRAAYRRAFLAEA